MKPIILTFTSFYLPGYRGGGPIRTIANMVERLSDHFDFRIVTSDRDLNDKQAYQDIQIDAWNAVGKASVFYASPAMRSLTGLAQILRETPHSILYLNSFFDSRFTLAPIFARWLLLAPKRPLVVAPRGEFSTGALRIKAWKKCPFIKVARAIGFFKDVYWHASTELEAMDIQRVLGVKNKNVHVARNIIIAPDIFQSETIPGGQVRNKSQSDPVLNICFLSRIVPIKNLEFALRVLSKVRAPVAFNIFGPKEDAGYWMKCQVLIESLPVHITVRDCGSVNHSEVKHVVESHDLFFVPSLGENFGHVFMESLSAGVPILVSDRTPWRDLEQLGLGWDIPLSRPENFVLAIEQAAQFSALERIQIKSRCINYAQKKSYDSSAVELNRDLFTTALASAN